MLASLIMKHSFKCFENFLQFFLFSMSQFLPTVMGKSVAKTNSLNLLFLISRLLDPKVPFARNKVLRETLDSRRGDSDSVKLP